MIRRMLHACAAARAAFVRRKVRKTPDARALPNLRKCAGDACRLANRSWTGDGIDVARVNEVTVTTCKRLYRHRQYGVRKWKTDSISSPGVAAACVAGYGGHAGLWSLMTIWDFRCCRSAGAPIAALVLAVSLAMDLLSKGKRGGMTTAGCCHPKCRNQVGSSNRPCSRHPPKTVGHLNEKRRVRERLLAAAKFWRGWSLCLISDAVCCPRGRILCGPCHARNDPAGAARNI